MSSNSPAARWQREYRRRRKVGVGILPVPTDLVRFERMLLGLGKIDREADDNTAVLTAVAADLIEGMIQAWEREMIEEEER